MVELLPRRTLRHALRHQNLHAQQWRRRSRTPQGQRGLRQFVSILQQFSQVILWHLR
jgi:hypothetical protein